MPQIKVAAALVVVGAFLSFSANVDQVSGSGKSGSWLATPQDVAASISKRQAGKWLVVATKRRGVKAIAGVPVRSTDPFDVVTVADFRQSLRRPQVRLRPHREACVYRWQSGIELTFSTFGLPIACSRRPLQAAKITKRAWSVKIGGQTFQVGDRRQSFPREMKRWPYFGHQLASMPFIGDRSPTVGVIFGGRGRAAAFNLFIGGAGD